MLIRRLLLLGEEACYTCIWNEDETGCFFRALPDKTLTDAKKACKGGKKTKIRIVLTFFVNASGEKEMPIVIGKSASPRCFKGYHKG